MSLAPLDVVVLVPFQPYTGHAIEPLFRQTMGSRLYPHFLRGYSEFARFVGRDLLFRDHNRPVFGDDRRPVEFNAHRSLTAVSLATHLERAGLAWKVLDPGQQEIRYYRRELEALRPRRPRVVGISTTFTIGGRWLRAMCAMVRDTLPDARIVLGGYYYTSDTADFLSMDADVYCVGEAELRFDKIINAIKDGGSLERIPGLYLRRPGAPHLSTGKAEQASLDALPAPDWSLADRIDPPRHIDSDFLDIGIETQRGCVFKCEFCTYRTLSLPNFMSTDVAVDHILATRSIKRAVVRITDSTATFPRERWADMMRKLIARGGSPHPLWAYARVSDIDDNIAQLMAAAGVREVFIGQESGDEEILGKMKKGTHIKQVRPALAALQKHGLWAFVSFIHGFPGETRKTIENTRGLITRLNEGFPEDRPAVAWYNVNPFLTQDFAAVAEATDAIENGYRYLGFDQGDENSTKRMADECLATMIASSRVPQAPVFAHTLTFLNSPARGAVEPEPSLIADPNRYALQRWVKAVERGIAIFIERDLDGKQPDLDELRRLREKILSRYPQRASKIARAAVQVMHRVLPAASDFARREWAAEDKRGVGLVTRLGLSALVLLDRGRLAPAIACLKTGEYQAANPTVQSKEIQSAARNLAEVAIDDARKSGKQVTAVVREANQGRAAGLSIVR
jgi:radical SAM superfamily enzyme YgiQ (UPF0313 family)